MNNKVLVIGPGSNTRGGITSVIKAYQSTALWNKWECSWISTYNDKSNLHKLKHAFLGFFHFLALLPFSNIVHIHFSWDSSTKRKLPFLFLSKLFRKKVIIQLHSGAEPIINSKIKNTYQYLFKNADVTLLLADAIKDRLVDNFKFNTVEVIYNPCLIHPNIQSVFSKPYIFYAGHINDNKGVYDLLLAFSNICNKYSQWKLIIAGSGDISRLESLISKYNIKEQTEFIGWIKDSRKDEVFKHASIFCLPSYTEGFPMAVLDAWAYGLPVITTPVGGLPDVLKHGENALVFEPGNIIQLAENLELLIKNKDIRDKLSKSSLKLSNTIFNIKTIEKQLDNLYTNLSLGK